MTKDEKTALLDAIDAAEKEAIGKAAALNLPGDAEGLLLKFAARIRTAVHVADTGDLPEPA